MLGGRRIAPDTDMTSDSGGSSALRPPVGLAGLLAAVTRQQ